MSGISADYLLLGAALLTIFPVGIALTRIFSRLSGLDLIGYGAAAGVFTQALFGLGVALFPPARQFVLLTDAALALVAIGYMWRGGVIRELVTGVPKAGFICLAIWLAYVVCCVAVTHVDVTLPNDLPDGRYIFKRPTVNVKLQYLTSLPADNTIPYIVTEYLLRGISFRDERPILPGNEVSNRTIQLSLVAVVYRAALSPPPRLEGGLGTFRYVGRAWPAVEKLYSDASYREVLVIGILLNSLLLLGLLVLFQNHCADGLLLPFAMVLAASNVYLISQTIFIWPKALAGFLLLLAWRSLRAEHHVALTAVCAALAYHSHPYAIVFAAGVVLYLLFGRPRGEGEWRTTAVYAGVFVLAVLPWLFWTQLIVRAPSNLLWQNVAGAGTDTAFESVTNFVWVRLYNLLALAVPAMFEIYPFDAAKVVEGAQKCLPGAVGIFLIVPAAWATVRAAGWQAFGWLTIGLPAFVIVLLFSYPALPILHGFQPVVGLLLFQGVAQLRQMVAPTWFIAISVLQFVANTALLALLGSAAGVHLI